MKAILIPFRIKNARGRLAPVKPAQVAQMFAKYEAQVMAELTAQGFTVTDLDYEWCPNLSTGRKVIEEKS